MDNDRKPISHKLLAHSLDQTGECKLGSSLLLLRVKDVFAKLCSSFGISVGFKNMAELFQDSSQFLVVSDNPVVNASEFIRRVGSVRVAVSHGRDTMCRPVLIGNQSTVPNFCGTWEVTIECEPFHNGTRRRVQSRPSRGGFSHGELPPCQPIKCSPVLD